MRAFLVAAVFAGFLFSCSADPAADTGDKIANDSTDVKDSAKVFVMPSPLQVSTFLQLYARTSHPEYLSDKTIPVANYSTDYQRAMNLGVCITDAGYAALYGDRQLTLDYLSRIEELVKKLRIEPAAAPYLVRVKNNLENKDSLSFLLLSMYNDVQKNLNEGQREKTAYYIMSGCYIENLAITLQHSELQTKPAFIQLVAQEKLWMDNITEALTFLEPDSSTQDLYNTFFTLQDVSKDIAVSTGDDNKPTCKFSAEQFTKFGTKSVQLRNGITGQKSA